MKMECSYNICNYQCGIFSIMLIIFRIDIKYALICTKLLICLMSLQQTNVCNELHKLMSLCLNASRLFWSCVYCSPHGGFQSFVVSVIFSLCLSFFYFIILFKMVCCCGNQIWYKGSVFPAKKKLTIFVHQVFSFIIKQNAFQVHVIRGICACLGLFRYWQKSLYCRNCSAGQGGGDPSTLLEAHI